MITPLPGAVATKPGTATLPFFGVDVGIVDDLGKEVGTNEQGKLVIKKPWPSMLRGIWGDKKRYQETYWSRLSKAGTSPATEPAATRTATSGSSAASTTC